MKKHIQTAKHQKNSTNQNKRKSTENLSNICVQNMSFVMRLALALLAANIPFFKLENEIFRKFLFEFTHQTIKGRTTVTKVVPELYNHFMENIHN